ncbi:MAG: polysaccharide deacetylase family protein [Actinomycetota bacterium]|nr:polysaccharide deacetylase family protein [Actinomycetota bacterium]
MAEKYIIFGFDMETDIGSYLKTYKGIRQGSPKILDILKKHGIEATFFFTGHAAQNNPDQVLEIVEQGHDLGCHSLKHETVGDAAFNMPNDCPILEEELERRLLKNIEIIKSITGSRPQNFRAPRLWQGHGQIKVLENLGFKVDASYSVATHEKQIIPYHPSDTDWLQPGNMNILEIPNFAFLDSENDYSRFFGQNDQWPLLRLLGAEFVAENQKLVVERQAELTDKCVLLFYLHPWEFEVMPEKFEYDEGTFLFKPELTQNCGPRMAEEFEKYIRLCLEDGYKFTTCSKFYHIWTSGCS